MGALFTFESSLTKIFEALRAAGGRPIVVGGHVRDRLLGTDSKDIDVEVFGLNTSGLHELLLPFGEVLSLGRRFGVFKVKGIDVDFSLPRRDNKTAAGHRGFEVIFDSGLDFTEAARRRDFTINSMGWDPLENVLLDPYGGKADLDARRLQVTDPDHFAEDPLRGLRAAQFIARFNLVPTSQLVDLCRSLDLLELPSERVGGEFSKLLLKGQQPSLGLEFLRQTDMLRFFPELATLVAVPQDPLWHPEGDVWTHTLLVVDHAAKMTHPRTEINMLAALCHDFGKPSTTKVDSQGRIHAPTHEVAGALPSSSFLRRLGASGRVMRQVQKLVMHHLAPWALVAEGAGAPAYLSLARELEKAGLDMESLLNLAIANDLGRASAGRPTATPGWVDTFRSIVHTEFVDNRPPASLVTGEHLIRRGLQPGPVFSEVLAACLSLQDETGWADADRILDSVLEQRKAVGKES